MYKLAKKAASREGFTLVELIVVIAILGILAGIAVPVYSGYISKANEAADQTLLAALNTAFAAACMEKGQFDLTQLPFNPEVTNIKVKPKLTDPAGYEGLSASFEAYYAGNGPFKTFQSVYYSEMDGAFKGSLSENAGSAALMAAWENSSFDKVDMAAYSGQFETVPELLNSTFDNCGELFQQLITNTSWQANMSNIMSMLALDGLMDDLNTAMSRETAVNYLEEKYGAGSEAELTEKLTAEGKSLDDVILTVQGNMAVKALVDDANNTSVGKLMENYSTYRQVATDAMNAAYAADGNTSNWMNYIQYPAGFSDTVSASTLGAVYGLAMAYYENKGDHYGTSYGDSTIALNALFENDFFAEGGYFDTHAKSDLYAYLGYMRVLSAQDVDLSSDTAFAGLSEIMNGLLGNGG